MHFVDTSVLRVAYHELGPQDGWPVALSHGFPYDVHAYDEVAPRLADAGARVIIPYLRGFGPTVFLSDSIMRSGQQAALGRDLIELLNALGIERALLAGYDWGGLASCVATALWPERVTGLVSYAGYDVIDVKRGREAKGPALEQVLWYQHLFQNERGRECLTLYRRDLCRILWQQWSPTWKFDQSTFERTAASFDNPPSSMSWSTLIVSPSGLRTEIRRLLASNRSWRQGRQSPSQRSPSMEARTRSSPGVRLRMRRCLLHVTSTVSSSAGTIFPGKRRASLQTQSSP